MNEYYICAKVENNVCQLWETKSVLLLDEGQGIVLGMQFLALCAFAYCVSLLLTFFLKG